MKTSAQKRPQSLGQERRPDASLIFGTVPFDFQPNESPHGRITAVSMMKDEGPFLLEWVAHHLAIGFTDIVVYTNDCSDGTDDMLIRMEQLGLVHHRRNVIAPGIRPQPSALKHAHAEPIVKNSDWVLVFDADEFLCLKVGDGRLDDLLTATKSAGANGVVITWRIFGSDGVQKWSRAPVTEQYLSAAPPTWNKGWGVKTLFQYDPDFWKLGIHRPKIKNKHLDTTFPATVKWLNGSGRPMEDYFKFRGWRSIMRTVGYDWAQMNHYAIKSMDSYAIRKFRGNVNNKKDKYNASYWSLQDRNEVHDASALAHKNRRQAIMDHLLADSVLAELHKSALDQVEQRLEEYRKTPEYNALIADLKTASSVPITEVEAKPPKPRDPRKIAAQMSMVEKRVTAHQEAERFKNPSPKQKVETHPYVSNHIDLSKSIPTQAFINHDIKLPADPRVFSAPALLAIAEGKFYRNHARRMPGLLQPGDRYLEIGAGVGFLSAFLANHFPGLAILAQEETNALYALANAVWDLNGVEKTPLRSLSNASLFGPGDAQHESSGLVGLIQQSKCTILYLNDPRLSAEMIAHALSKNHVHAPDRVVIGPRTLAGECDKKICGNLLSSSSYEISDDQPLNLSIYAQLRQI